MEIERLTVSIERDLDDENIENKSVVLRFTELDNIAVTLSGNNTLEIEKLFNSIFDRIVNQKKIIEFTLDDVEKDLFKEVAEEIVIQLNAEIKESESNFERIIELS